MQYNDLIYTSGITTVKEYVSNKYNVIHNNLYKDALKNYVNEYTKDIILNKILYNLFVAMNNCITQFNDDNNIVNLDILNELKTTDKYKTLGIITQDEITNDLINQEYINILKDFINNSSYAQEFNDSFNLLSITLSQKEKYINYIIVNIISLMEDIKSNLINIQTSSPATNSNISDFIIKYNNVIYVLSENNELIETERSIQPDSQEIFIYEEQYKLDYHIGFNSNGEFIIDINPEIDIIDYDKLYYLILYINNLLLNLLIEDITEKYINSNIIIEKPQDEYYKPSSIIIYQNTYPHYKKIIDLSPYWSNYNDHSDIKIEDIKIKGEPINDSQIEDINYVTGNIKIYSKMHDLVYNINNKYINADTNINDELINQTFFQNI